MGTLIAPFVHDVLGGDARAFGVIMAAQAVGGIVGGLAATLIGHHFAPPAADRGGRGAPAAGRGRADRPGGGRDLLAAA